jgi:hypothetical protein
VPRVFHAHGTQFWSSNDRAIGRVIREYGPAGEVAEDGR